MGQQKSKSESGDAEKAPQITEQNIVGLEIKYTKTFTNSELSIGNRDVIEFCCKNRKGGTYTKEEHGIIKICVPYSFLDETCKEYLEFYQNCFDSNQFFSLGNKSAKRLTTSGSDAGTSIIVEFSCKEANVRKEVRNSERITLSGPNGEERFKNIEKCLLQFNHKMIQKQYISIKAIISERILNHYHLIQQTSNHDNELVEKPFNIGFIPSLSSPNSVSEIHDLIIVMSKPSHEMIQSENEKNLIIPNAFLPKDQKVKIILSEWDLLESKTLDLSSNHNGNDMTFFTENEILFSESEENATFRFDLDENKCKLTVTKI